jgi:hypothetical protein
LTSEAKVTTLSSMSDSVSADGVGPPEGGTVPLDGLVRRLAAEFPTVHEEAIVEVVRGTAANYRNARIPQYVGIFVERESREHLRRAAVPTQRVSLDDE